MTQLPTIFALLMIGVLSGAQVLTVGPNGHSRWQSKLTEKERALLVPALQSATGEYGPGLLKLYTAFEVPLSRTGAPGIVAISDEISPQGNSAFLVFRQKSAAYVPILNTVAGAWDLKDTRHQGYRDIVLTNYQGVQQMISTWEFDGRQYHVTGCIQRTTDGAQREQPLNRCGL